MRYVLLIAASLFVLTGCGQMSLKRSASNRLVDFSGFEGHKRRPVYNKKYITKAKRNVAESNFEEDEYNSDEVDADEVVDPASRNRMMYRDMLERDRLRKQKASGNVKKPYQDAVTADDEGYPSLSESRQRVDSKSEKSSEDMQRELSEIKKMLSDTKKDMAKYRCPLQNKGDGASDSMRKQGTPSLSSGGIGAMDR